MSDAVATSADPKATASGSAPVVAPDTSAAPAAVKPASSGGGDPAAAAGGALAKAEAPKVEAPKRLLSDTPDKPAEPVKPTETPKVEEVKPVDWKLEAPKDAPLSPLIVPGIEKFAKENGLTKVQAEKMVAERIQFDQAETTRINDAWHQESMADPEIGGEKMPQTIMNVQRVLAAIATPEERKQLINTPFANNKWLLSILSKAAKLLPREDNMAPSQTVVTSNHPRTPEEAARKLYGHLSQK